GVRSVPLGAYRQADGHYFSLNGSRGYLFYTGQPAFCRGCLQHGHEVSRCRDLKCKNCLGQGHLAKDCQDPCRCKNCGGEGHLAHSCPRHKLTYATVLAGAGGGRRADPYKKGNPCYRSGRSRLGGASSPPSHPP
uniref:CCHC-type domain-containing protein n=1 Tax=Pygocentrus nattereri TaxID=42514 RepID=A0A3B4EIY3_PYGNA